MLELSEVKYVFGCIICMFWNVSLLDKFYGAAVKLPELLAYVNIEEEALTRLQQKLLDFLKYVLVRITYMF